MTEGGEGNHPTAGSRNVNIGQRARVLPELRRHLHHDKILVYRREGRGDFPFAKRVVENAVDRLGRDAEARCGSPVLPNLCSAHMLVLL